MGKGQDLYNKAKTLIPGGTMLLSKRPEMFLPENWPSYFSKAKGCKIWDLENNELVELVRNLDQPLFALNNHIQNIH